MARLVQQELRVAAVLTRTGRHAQLRLGMGLVGAHWLHQ